MAKAHSQRRGHHRPVGRSLRSCHGDVASVIGSPRIFTLTQEGGKLTGTVEGPGGWFGGEDAPAAIGDGVVRATMFRSSPALTSSTAASKTANSSSSAQSTFRGAARPSEAGSRAPVIGPAPDGSDPSFDNSDFAGAAGTMSLVLKRADR